VDCSIHGDDRDREDDGERSVRRRGRLAYRAIDGACEVEIPRGDAFGDWNSTA
jgi:hypothetical protein